MSFELRAASKMKGCWLQAAGYRINAAAQNEMKKELPVTGEYSYAVQDISRIRLAVFSCSQQLVASRPHWLFLASQHECAYSGIAKV